MRSSPAKWVAPSKRALAMRSSPAKRSAQSDLSNRIICYGALSKKKNSQLILLLMSSDEEQEVDQNEQQIRVVDEIF